MANVKQNALYALKESLAKCDALIEASLGNDSSCAVFRDGFPFVTDWTDEHKRAVRLYVDSWIRDPLALAIKSIEGDRSFNTECALDSIAGKGWY